MDKGKVNFIRKNKVLYICQQYFLLEGNAEGYVFSVSKWIWWLLLSNFCLHNFNELPHSF